MKSDGESARKRARALAERLNALPIAIFSLWLGPLVLFWLESLGPMRSFGTPAPAISPIPWLFASFAVGALILRLPRGWYAVRRFEASGRFHERVGARTFRAFVPNGDMVNRTVARRYPGYRVHPHHGMLDVVHAGTVLGEKWHLAAFVVGIPPALYAAAIDWWGWSLWLVATDVLCNLYPALLQRYTRARVESVRAGRLTGSPQRRGEAS